MLSKTFGLLFYLKKQKNYVRGKQPIYMRITVDYQRAEISTKREIEPERWNSPAGRATGTKEEVKALNAYLDTLQSKVYEIHRYLVDAKEPITVEAIKNKLIGVEEKPRMILEIFQHHNDQVEKLIGKDFSAATLERYKTSLEHTKNFILWKYGLADLEINKLNYEFISEYGFWLKSERNCNHNSTMKYLANFKKIVLICIKNGWIARDPFTGYKLTKKEVVRDYLLQDELETISTKQFSTTRLSQVRDIFLFSCFTGLAYADVKKLKRSEIGKGIDGEKWIFTSRQKTDTQSRIPLLPVTLGIIEQYNDHPQCINEDRVLPVLSNQKMNGYLKEIADVCEIHKNLTFHIARHTFATTVTLSNGVPMESVSKMLGHKNLRTTQHYAKILDRKVSDDMKLLKEKLK